ncbi:MAG: HAMP domain-containing histidine kinase [Bacteroidetes bacterium]|nr:MAG: HAMP domain-containing histidine kinase [Bacteroidota bacterium]
MKAYRVSVNLKLGLILFAVAIAVSSLWYTKDLANRLRSRETSIIQLWASALEQVPKVAQEGSINPFQNELRDLEFQISRGSGLPLSNSIEEGKRERYRQALVWAQSMPPASDLTFILSAFLEPNTFDIPAILEDSILGTATIWRNIPNLPESLSELDSILAVDPVEYERIRDRLSSIQTEMDEVHRPIPIVVAFPSDTLNQRMHYGESSLVTAVRWFPYVQLGFVSLFVLVGYFGFSYVRSSEQKSLWVGMAKEAAHQLGTPISSLMGWLEVLRAKESVDESERLTFDEIEKDIQRLTRVSSRFSGIGSLPKLDEQSLKPVIENISEYMRRRLPQGGKTVELSIDIPEELKAPLNAELFEWVIENLLKNAIDATLFEQGKIDISAKKMDGNVLIDVSDRGKGIDRRQWKNVFRPGYSTKKRGWGLGLSLARRIVEDYHGGSLVLLHSRPDEGTTFRITLPSSIRKRKRGFGAQRDLV